MLAERVFHQPINPEIVVGGFTGSTNEHSARALSRLERCIGHWTNTWVHRQEPDTCNQRTFLEPKMTGQSTGLHSVGYGTS